MVILRPAPEAVVAPGKPHHLPVSTGCLMATRVMHRLAVKLCAMFGWALPARGHSSVVALPIIEMMIDVSVEMIRPVVPRSGPDKYTA